MKFLMLEVIYQFQPFNIPTQSHIIYESNVAEVKWMISCPASNCID